MSQQLFPTTPFMLNDVLGEPRKAALLLHAMRPRDQRWILDQLDTGQRMVLQDLLAELKELGIPAEPSLLDAVADRYAGPSPSMMGDAEAIMQIDPAVLVQVLSQEPAGLIARLLELEAWPWSSHLLDGLEPSKRRDVETRRAALARSPIGPEEGDAVRRHLLVHVATRMPHRASHTRIDGRASGSLFFGAIRKVRTLWHRARGGSATQPSEAGR